MATIEVINVAQTNPEAPIEIQLSNSNLIYRGPAGKDGVIGRDGKSAYEIAVDNGFVGTEAEWIASLGSIGPQGPKGDTPVKGVDYFTEQDIEDFIAQVPSPNLNDYKKALVIQDQVYDYDDELMVLLRSLSQTAVSEQYQLYYGKSIVFHYVFYSNAEHKGMPTFYYLSVGNHGRQQEIRAISPSCGEDTVRYQASYSSVLKLYSSGDVMVPKNSSVFPVDYDPTATQQFKYLKDNYATKAYVDGATPEYLTNNDILAIWNGE